MVCSRWPEPRKSKKNKKTKTADHMSTESDKNPNGVFSFVFLFFLDFRGFCIPNGVCSFFVFRGFCMACFAPDGQQQERLLVYIVIFSISAANRRL